MKSVNTDIAYEYIRKKILSGEYPPGKSLMTEVLAADIKVSRTPVRDALRKLETDGLVTIRAHLGASVKRIELKEFREMCELRLALEGHAAGLAALNHTEMDLHEIHFALEAMRGITAKIHIAIISAAKNDLIKKEILRLHLINRVAMIFPGASAVPKTESDARRRVVLAKHEDIYAAIARSDPVGAKQEMEAHLQEWIDRTMLLLTRAERGALARDLTPDEMLYTS
jgi:DNA-binding GntR family transcriptional regulator